MQRLATGLLLLMAVVFVLAGLGQERWPGLGYVRAFAEAAMVGACADWFAVTALFRQPFGLPIPHTGIIPRSRDRIGQALGNFISGNFLTAEVLDERLRELEVARWGGAWLKAPGNARALAERIAKAAPSVLAALPRDALGEVAGQAASAAIRAVPAAPAASKLLKATWSDARAQAIADWALPRLADYLSRRKDLVEAKVEAQSQAWIPRFVDRMIAGRVSAGLLQMLEDMRDPAHPSRLEISDGIAHLIERLADDPEMLIQGEKLKAEALANPELRRQALALWRDLEQQWAGGHTPGLAPRLEAALLALGDWMQAEDETHAKLNAWARRMAREVIAPQRHDIGRFVAQVVSSWDTKSIVDKLELQVGKDLQYIRINGTLVGGLVGLVIYSVGRLLGI